MKFRVSNHDQRRVERILKALANRRRIAIILHLGEHGASSVSSIAESIPISIMATSQHLRVLSNAGIVDSEKFGRHVLYDLQNSREIMRHISRLF